MCDDKFWQVREWANTLPQSQPTEETKFYRGVEDIRVDYIDGPVNPYKALFTGRFGAWDKSFLSHRVYEHVIEWLVR
jgi:hypothetical protein